MTLWIVLAAMTAMALAMVLTPLFRRPAQAPGRGEFAAAIYREQIAEVGRDRERGLLDHAHAEAARAEIGRRLLSTRAKQEATPRAEAPHGGFRLAAVAVGIAVPAGAVALYLILGTPNLATGGGGVAPRQIATESQGPNIEALVARLGDGLRGRPDDAKGWALYARSLAKLGRFTEAVPAFQHAITLDAGNAGLSSRYAEALIFANDGTVTPAAHRAIEAALALDGSEPRARYYLGLADSQAGRRRMALERWLILEAEAAEDVPWRPVLRRRIEQLARELGLDRAALADLRTKAGRQAAPSTGAAPAPRGPSSADVAAARQMSPEDRDAMIRAMVARLAERLKGAPGDLAGWRRLARAYAVLGEGDKARAARERIRELERNPGSGPPAARAARDGIAARQRETFAAGTQAFDGGDYATAFENWHLLAAAGEAEAQTAIAGMYRRGEGRRVDLAKAASWYRRAAKQGDAVAQLNLGEMYRGGQGVKRDNIRAFAWFTLAATQGSTWAAGELKKLTRIMTADEITRAAGRLRELRPPGTPAR